jgi:alkylation response protein AidB-like acyl-CoA dehydrogenase
MDLDWTPRDLELIASARHFAEERLRPSGPAQAFDEAAWRACAEHGVLGLPLPGAWGGRAESALTTVGIFEALGRGGVDRGLLFALGAHLFGCAVAIARHASEEQQARWGRRLADGSAVAALAITDPAGGSDPMLMGMHALPGADGYVLTGEKTLVTNGPRADVFLTIARTDGPPGPLGLSAFLVPRESPGLTVDPLPAQAGLAAAPVARVRFDGCRVPRQALVGAAGAGLTVMTTGLRWERSCLLAGLLGAADRDLDTSLAHARSRRVVAHEAVAHRLARMKLRLESARWLVYRAAWSIDRKRSPLLAPALAKVAASECLVDNAMDALRILAGPGWLDEAGAASALADAIGTLSASGTNDVQLGVIAASLGSESA